MTAEHGEQSSAVPCLLYDLEPLIAGQGAQGRTGVAWRLAEEGRQLDANVVHLPPGGRIDTHMEPDLDVLMVVVAGSATITTGDEVLTPTAGVLVWLPRGSTRSLSAGAEGLTYLTLHRRRPGMQIRSRPPRP